MAGGPMADSATRILTLQALPNLGGHGGGKGHGSGGHDTFEEYAFGLVGSVGGGHAAADGDPYGDCGNIRGGSASVMKVQAAIRRDPARWVEAYNGYLRRELGAEELGVGWSAAEYGRRRVGWGGKGGWAVA
jgi:hypothetical protein